MSGKEIILIVDDEESIIEVASEVLDRQGYHILASAYGSEAIAMYEKTTPPIDLVILDVNLPDMSGEDVLDRLHDINPHVKVILSSGYNLSEKANALTEKGVRQFLQKPFRMMELIKKVRNALDEE